MSERGFRCIDAFAGQENERFLVNPNAILGVYDGERLVAYGSVGFLGDSPDNIYSLRNVQAEGFEILAKKEKYGGKERYILGK